MGAGVEQTIAGGAPEAGMGANEGVPPHAAPESGMGANEGVRPHAAPESGLGKNEGVAPHSAPESGMGADEGIGAGERPRDEENEYGLGSGRGDDQKPGKLEKMADKLFSKKDKK